MQAQKPRQHEARGTRPDNSNLRPHKPLSDEIEFDGLHRLAVQPRQRTKIGKPCKLKEPNRRRELRVKRLRINTTYAVRKH